MELVLWQQQMHRQQEVRGQDWGLKPRSPAKLFEAKDQLLFWETHACAPRPYWQQSCLSSLCSYVQQKCRPLWVVQLQMLAQAQVAASQ